MRKLIRRWLFGGNAELTVDMRPEEAVDKPRPKVRIAVMEAMNGKLLEVQSYQRNNHGPDWKSEFYILEEGKPLADQIAVVMTMRGMGV